MRQGRGPHDRASLTNHFPKTRPATGSGVRTRPGVQFAGVPSENSVRRDAEHDTRGGVCSPDVSKLAEAVQRTREATEGSPFQAGAKAFLEHNIQLNLVPDRFPDGLPDEVAEPAHVGSEEVFGYAGHKPTCRTPPGYLISRKIGRGFSSGTSMPVILMQFWNSTNLRPVLWRHPAK